MPSKYMNLKSTIKCETLKQGSMSLLTCIKRHLCMEGEGFMQSPKYSMCYSCPDGEDRFRQHESVLKVLYPKLFEVYVCKRQGRNMKTITVKQAVLKAIIANYPKVKNHIIHNACPQHLFSSGQRLRELRKLGVVYSFDVKTNTYDFSNTPLRVIGDLLKGMAGEDEKGEKRELPVTEHSSHPSPATNKYKEAPAIIQKELW